MSKQSCKYLMSLLVALKYKSTWVLLVYFDKIHNAVSLFEPNLTNYFFFNTNMGLFLGISFQSACCNKAQHWWYLPKIPQGKRKVSC